MSQNQTGPKTGTQFLSHLKEFMSNLPPRRYDEAAQKLANVVDDEE